MSPSLREELKLRTPFASLEQEAQLNVARTGALLNDDFEVMLRPYGLSGPAFNVLRILRGAEPDMLCRNEIRDRMLSRMPDMTRLLDRLERWGAASGAVRTVGGWPRPRRGAAAAGQLDPRRDREQKRRFSHLDPEQLRADRAADPVRR
jgi:hypothetical protein